MSTRMEKYYGHSSKKPKENMRSNRNKNLYSEIYTYGNYSNIEGIAEIGKSNEVDIQKVRELLQSREKPQNKRQYRRNIKEYEKPEVKTAPKIEEKNYDIRDILKEAKENKEPDDKERVLKNTQYNILKNIDLKKEIKKEDYFKDDEELKEMIQTITNTSMLNKLADVDLAEDLLSDLKADDTKVGEVENLQGIINDAKASKEETNYDHSFFTSSLKLNKSDFVDGEKPKRNILNIIIIVILVIIMIISATILIMNNLN